jgi:hypothetical protein
MAKPKTQEKKFMKAPNCLAIMAILAEMARCVNQNIAKVQLAPLDASLAIDDVAGAGVESVGTIKH